jgi:Uma2 family endonuclease
MTPIGPGHHACVMRLTHLLTAAVGTRAWVSVQGPLAPSGTEVRYPDLALLRRASDAYEALGPRAADALLVVEVADTSLAQDREIKVPRYAAAGVPEVWIVDLAGGVHEVHREPAGATYASVERREPGEVASPAAFADVAVPVAVLLG